MNSFFYDLRYGWRQLSRNPGFTFIAVLCLGLGIGACAAIYTLADALLIRPFGFDHSKYVLVYQRSVDWPDDKLWPCSRLSTDHWIKHSQTLEGVMPTERSSSILGTDEHPLEVINAQIPAGFFAFMQSPLLLGNEFSKEQEAEGNNQVVLLSHGFWQSQFAGNPEVLGTEITLDSEKHTVIGILDQQAGKILPFDVAIPMDVDRIADQTHYNEYQLLVFGKLQSGATPKLVEGELNTLGQALYEPLPDVIAPVARVMPLTEKFTSGIRPLVLILSVAVGLVLLIGCANVANLLLSRGVGRTHEVAVRSALGAGRWRLIRQFLTENMLLSFVGGLLGILIAVLGVDFMTKLLRSALGDNTSDYFGLSVQIGEFGLNGWVLLFGLGLTLVTAILFGAVPAVSASRTNLTQTIKEGSSHTTEQSGHRWLRSSLVVGEIALAFLLLVGAAASARSFAKLNAVDLGMQADQVFTARLIIPESVYDSQQKKVALADALLPQLEAIPGVESSGITREFLFSPYDSKAFYKRDADDDRPSHELAGAQMTSISPGLLETLRVPVLSGRDFREGDHQAQRILVSQRLAEVNWPGGDAVGRVIYMSIGPDSFIELEVIGVIGDVRREVHREHEPVIYFPYQALGIHQIQIAVRTQRDLADITRDVEQAVWAIDPNLPVTDIDVLRRRVQEATSTSRVGMMLMNILSGTALLLAVMGIYGVMSYNVNQRRRDIAIRMTLGAHARWILQNILGRGLLLTAIGLVVGLAGAVVLLNQFGDTVFEVDPIDPAVLAGVSLGLAAVAAFACLVPAWRATRIQPMELLRDE